MLQISTVHMLLSAHCMVHKVLVNPCFILMVSLFFALIRREEKIVLDRPRQRISCACTVTPQIPAYTATLAGRKCFVLFDRERSSAFIITFHLTIVTQS